LLTIIVILMFINVFVANDVLTYIVWGLVILFIPIFVVYWFNPFEPFSFKILGTFVMLILLLPGPLFTPRRVKAGSPRWIQFGFALTLLLILLFFTSFQMFFDKMSILIQGIAFGAIVALAIVYISVTTAL